MRQIQFIIFSMALLFSVVSFSQEGYSVVTQDLESWNSLQLKYKVNKKFGIGLEHGLRLNQNASVVDQSLTELNFKWKPVSGLFFGTGFRYIADRGGNNLFDNDFRFNLDAGFKHDINRLEFKYCLRYQNRNEIGLSTEEGDYFRNYLRLKAGVSYNIKNWKLDPTFSTELYRDMTRYTGSFDRLRFTLGTDYSLGKAGKIGAFYRIERELGVSYPKTTYIIGLGYTFTIKRK